jgi:hypothetical protein
MTKGAAIGALRRQCRAKTMSDGRRSESSYRSPRRLTPSGKLDDLDLAVQQIELEAEVPCFLPTDVPKDARAGIANERQRDGGMND